MNNIEKIDKNLAINNIINDEKFEFYNVRFSPIKVYGLMHNERFIRLNENIASEVSDGVERLNYNTAGGRVRFKTDTDKIVVRAMMPQKCLMSHMTFAGSSGFDMYMLEADNYKYIGTFMNSYDRGDIFESVVSLPERKMRDITINFPLYDVVEEMYIGVTPDSIIEEGGEYRNDKPIVYYGSSITQGGCASRPGNSYQGIISRRFNCDYINLGFAGCAKGEATIAKYIASLNMELLFLDYDHNSVVHELRQRHEMFFKIVREKNPNLPIIMATRTNIPGFPYEVNEMQERKNIIFGTYQNAINAGDKNVYYIDGGEAFKLVESIDVNPDSCTVDGCHPNDLGFACMAKVFGDEISKALGW